MGLVRNLLATCLVFLAVSCVSTQEKWDYSGPKWPNDRIRLLIEKSDKGDIDSTLELGNIYYSGSGVDKDYQLAFSFYETAAKNGSVLGLSEVGYMYVAGEGVDRDYQKGREALSMAAGQNDRYAQYWLGEIYRQGLGVPVDKELALTWFQKAADQGEPRGELMVGKYYRDVKEDYLAALDWFSKASSHDDPWATIEMAHLYAAGLGVRGDLKKAFDLTQQAALGDTAQAEYELAEKYEIGSGTEISLVAAGMWYRIAARGKYKDAADRLTKIESQLSPAEIETEKESASDWVARRGWPY